MLPHAGGLPGFVREGVGPGECAQQHWTYCMSSEISAATVLGHCASQWESEGGKPRE